ncbi:MAG: VOC family protein [Herpetosiphonaceae bacterium]|nr:VOC family protein [Herpetosiphonaceae bacterium]
MQIVGLDHVQLVMPAGEEAAARHFYATILGLTEVPKPEQVAGRGGCWFAGPGVALHLGVEADFTPARKAHPALRVADLGQARQTLERAGVAITDNSTLPHVRRFFVADPFGNRIEILQDGDVY